MSEKKGKGLRSEMPGSAALVDELRALFGADWVDAALRQGMSLQREHARLGAERGQAAADAWLRQQRPTGPALQLVEGDRQVGLLPARISQAQTEQQQRRW
jgi:hypothetical protein